jgi:hypothetical protein
LGFSGSESREKLFYTCCKFARCQQDVMPMGYGMVLGCDMVWLQKSDSRIGKDRNDWERYIGQKERAEISTTPTTGKTAVIWTKNSLSFGWYILWRKITITNPGHRYLLTFSVAIGSFREVQQ